MYLNNIIDYIYELLPDADELKEIMENIIFPVL